MNRDGTGSHVFSDKLDRDIGDLEWSPDNQETFINNSLSPLSREFP